MNASRIKGIIIQSLYNLKHSYEDIVDTFFWPIMDVIIWGFMTTFLATAQGNAAKVVSFLMGGLILWNIVWRAQQDIALALLRNVWNRNILNLFSSPLTPWEFVTATMILGFIKIIFTLVIVSFAAFVLYSFNLFSLGFSLIPFFISLIAFAWAVGIFITGLIIRYGMRIQSLAWSFIAILQPVSAVFYPLSILPPFLRKIAWFLPTTHIFEGMRQILSGGQLSKEHLLWAFGLNIIYLILSAWFFIFMFEKSREKGKLAEIET